MTSVDEVRQRLIHSGLLQSEVLESQIATWSAVALDRTDGASLVDYLIDQELLTEFQGEAILAGHTGPFMLGPYRVYEQVAAGRLGGVFRAVHAEFDQPVSLKVFPAALANDPERLARLGREVRVAVTLDHPNVVRSFQVGRVGPVYYLALEDLAGETLAARLSRDGSLPFAEACRVARDIARGLSHLHANEIVHRDVRPANVWLTATGGVKLMEFGAARDSLAFLDALDNDDGDDDGDDLDLGGNEAVAGEYDYVAPEQAYDPRQADAQSDLYALGCTLFHCLAGRPPFTESNPVRQALRHVHDTPPHIADLVPDVPHQIDETLGGMLAKQPGDRFRSADDVAFALAPFAGEEAEQERIVVVDVSPEYLEWVQSSQPEPIGATLSESSVAVTPELTEFLGWMGTRQRRQKRRN
jgi:serine/threonine protein kinase